MLPDGAPDLEEAVCCSNAVCAQAPPVGAGAGATAAQRVGGRLETLQHAFLDCPAVAPALRWVRRLWRRMSGASPPNTAAVWLQGVEGTWAGRGRATDTWRVLRALLLTTVWELRCTRLRTGRQFGAADVIAAYVERVRRQVEADWQRISSSMFDLAGACPTWFCNVHTAVWGLPAFEARWCQNGVIAVVAPPPPGARGWGSLLLQLTEASVALPTGGAAAAGGAGGVGGGGGGGGDICSPKLPAGA